MCPHDFLSNFSRPIVVVLTGGIASGKSTVSAMFEELRVPVIDTDVIARRIVEPGEPTLAQILIAFGDSILGPGERLDRQKLRSQIFSDPVARTKLESIMHPVIRAKAISEINSLEAPYCILVVPLFVESGEFTNADRVLVVDVDESTQIDRLLKRGGISIDLAHSMITAQAKRIDRLNIAHDIIINNGSLRDLNMQVKHLHHHYLNLATNREMPVKQ